MKKIEILGLSTVPDIKPGDKLGEIIVGCAKDEVGGIKERDIIVVTSKIVSKALRVECYPGSSVCLSKRDHFATESIRQ